MSTAATIALRFQRNEILEKADLTDVGLAVLGDARGPEDLVAGLSAAGNARDAVYALALMLPHRQAVWWSCLAVRLLPDLAQRPKDLAAVEAAEAWVQSVAASDAEKAGALAEACDSGLAPAWAATAAYWSGPSLAPRGQQPVAPPPHLPGVATRTALLLLTHEPSLRGRVTFEDLLGIGRALMTGDLGRQAQATVRERLTGR